MKDRNHVVVSKVKLNLTNIFNVTDLLVKLDVKTSIII